MSQNSENKENSIPYSSKTIRKAIEKLESTVGRATIETLVQDLELYGLPLANDRTLYTITDIQTAMEKIFGPEGCLLIMARLRILLK